LVVKIERELSEHFANIAGEGMVGWIMALTALDTLMALAPNDEARRSALKRFEKSFDNIFDRLKHLDGDPEMNERSKEVARARCDAALAQLRKTHLPNG
jgi:hypothetical protein